MSIYFKFLGAVFLTGLVIAFLLVLFYLVYTVLSAIRKGCVSSKCILRVHSVGFGDECIKEYHFDSLAKLYENLCLDHHHAVIVNSYSELAYRDFLEEDSK